MINKKRKGHALLTVIGMFAMISILVVTMINGVMASYELTKNSNERLETFYSADSGIEIAYNEMISVVKNAINEGYERVNSIEEGGAPIDINRNLVNTLKEDWKDDVFKKEFKEYLFSNLEISIDNVKYNSPIYDKFSRKGKIIKVEANMSGVNKESTKEKMNIHIKSKFVTKEGKDREVEVDYNILVPEYGIREHIQSTKGNANIFDYTLAADGNSMMNYSTSFNVLGDMWVKGDELRDSNDPLSSGVLFKDNGFGSIVEWHGNIVTNGTLDIQNGNFKTPRSNQKDYNIYAKNFRYTGNPRNKRYLFSDFPVNMEDSANDSGMNLHVYNDFIFDGTNTNLNIKNFYGLNDVSQDENIGLNQDAKVASSMIIDSEDFGGVNLETGNSLNTSSNINIANDTMILGTAYLNMAKNPLSKNEFFKTGESIVINRHSSPYTYRGYTENEYLYKYKEKLHIIDKLYKNGNYQELSILDKINLVEKFYNENLNNDKEKDKILSLGKGLKLNEEKTFTAGLAYSDGKVIRGQSEAVEKIINQKKEEFSREVYFMKDSSANISTEDFENAKVVNTVGDTFNWDAIMSVVNGTDIKEGEKILFKKEKDEHNQRNGAASFKGVSEELLVTKILDGEEIDGIPEAKINILLNYSNNDLILRVNNPVPDEKKEEGKVYINLEGENISKGFMYPTLIISKGDVILEKPKGVNVENGNMAVTSLIYTAGNLKFNVFSGSSNIGNYHSDDTKLNRVFKKFFTGESQLGRSIFDDFLGGSKSEEFEKIVNAEDLIKKGQWKLSK
ncbi:MAG: hypothetical protein ACRCTZ_22885 [Sarcina sp.]